MGTVHGKQQVLFETVSDSPVMVVAVGSKAKIKATMVAIALTTASCSK